MTKNNRKNTRIVGIVFRIVGLIFLMVGAVLTYMTYDFMEYSVATTGTVISVSENYSDDGGVTYRPTIRFVDNTGSKRQAKTFISSSGYNFPIKSDVDILYDTRDPTSLRLDNWFETWGFGIIFLASGIVPLFIASIVGRSGSQKSRNKPAVKARRAPTREANDGYVHMELEELPEDHLRETNYVPAVRRDNSGPTIRRRR